jgi:ATP-dependent Clp protease ATP-binding subunit ClpC
MIERYMETAHRVIFFARREASHFGSLYIETEHLLSGLLREDKALHDHSLRSHTWLRVIRKQIEDQTAVRENISELEFTPS